MTRKKSRFGYAGEQAGAAKTELSPETESQEKTEVLAKETVTEKPEVSAGSRRGAAHALEHPEAYALPPQRRGLRAAEGEVRRSDLPREQLNVRVRPELKRAAAAVAALKGVSLGDVVESALIEYIRQHRQQ